MSNQKDLQKVATLVVRDLEVLVAPADTYIKGETDIQTILSHLGYRVDEEWKEEDLRYARGLLNNLGAYLKKGHLYPFPKADHTVDPVVFCLLEGELSILLIRRGREREPFFESWALPGGFIGLEETLEQSVRRELREETGLDLAYLEQIKTFGDPGRDPRGRVITTAFMALVTPQPVMGGDDASEAKWWPVAHLPPLAFDHGEIIQEALNRLRAKIMEEPLAQVLMPPEFTLPELQAAYESILDQDLEKRSFRRTLDRLGFLSPTGEEQAGVGRPAKLYRFRENP